MYIGGDIKLVASFTVPLAYTIARISEANDAIDLAISEMNNRGQRLKAHQTYERDPDSKRLMIWLCTKRGGVW